MIDEKHEKLTEMVEDFCDEYLTDEYKELSLKTVEIMADARSVPFKRGKLEVWASAVVYSVCQIYSLFDESNEVHIERKDILNYFNTKQGIVSRKAVNLKNRFDLENKLLPDDEKKYEILDFDEVDLTDEESLYLNVMESRFGDDLALFEEDMSIEDYQKAIDGYKKQFGEEFFEEHEGHFWLIKETRPFMQCVFNQAQLLWQKGKKDEAIDKYKYLLKLNPNDNQGVRDSLLPNLTELNRLDEAEELYLEFEEDGSANWKFGKLLLDIKNDAPFDEIEMQYKTCIEYNPYVVPYLLGNKKLPSNMPFFHGVGDENEAIFYVILAYNAWHSDRKAMKVLKKLSKNK